MSEGRWCSAEADGDSEEQFGLYCCTPSHHGECTIGPLSDSPGSTPSASSPMDTGSPRLLRGQQDHYSRTKLPQGISAASGTARSSSGASSVSPEARELEKARLQRLVRGFAKDAVTGLAVVLVNPDTARKLPFFFQMDRYLTVFSLKPKDGALQESSVQDFNVKDVTEIYKGPDVAVKVPALGNMATFCVGLDTNRADRRIFFYFEEAASRDKFYTCLKILRMSVDITGTKAA